MVNNMKVYFLIAKTKVYEGEYCALVGRYETEDDARVVKACEEICWSDEGATYEITMEDPQEKNLISCTYHVLLERICK